MTSINIKVIGLTRSGIKLTGSRFELARFIFPDLPAWETHKEPKHMYRYY